MGYIYLRTNRINGKKYVGQAVDIEKRQRQWNRKGHYAGKAIYNARKKYGVDAFEFEILKECQDNELNYWEMFYIKELNTKVPYGYNMTDGGDGLSGCQISDETRRKLSEIHKGENHWFFGKHWSEEAKKKMSESHKGKKLTEETIKKIKEANKGRKRSEETIKKMSEARMGENHPMYGKHHTEEAKNKISESLKGENHPMYGKHHTEETIKKMSEVKSKSVFQINPITNEVIAKFPSAKDAHKQLGYNQSKIGECCNGKRKTCGGYKWKFAV